MIDDQIPIGEEAAEPGKHLKGLIAEYAVKRRRREQIDDEKRAAQDAEAIAEARLFDAIEAQGLRSVKSEEFGLFILSDLAWAAVTDVAVAREWIDQEMPEILSPNATKLALIVREAIRGERSMPPGIEAKYTRRINWRRS